MAPLELDKQIPKRGDQRQMEAWQRIGTYAAGLALDSAGVKGNAELLSRMDMIVAAGGGERDYAVDAAILSALPAAADPGAFLNEHLLSDLRPTLFLAQLSNLLAGNISIVHGVVGSSRTFMGEEASGTDAVRIACARIAAGQGDLFLVGGSYNAQRPDVLLHYEMGQLLWKRAVRRRLGAPGAGRRHGAGLARLLPGDRKPRARRRRAAPRRWRISRRSPPTACRRRPARRPPTPTHQLMTMRHHLEPPHAAVISGASGAAAPTQRGGRLPARSRHAGARHGDGVRPFAGAVVPGQPGAGRDGAVAAAAVRAARATDRKQRDGRRRTAPGAGDVAGATGAARRWPWSRRP